MNLEVRIHAHNSMNVTKPYFKCDDCDTSNLEELIEGKRWSFFASMSMFILI